MAFKNPWGKGSGSHDRWFSNLWEKGGSMHSRALSTNISDAQTTEAPAVDHWEIKNSGNVSPDNKCYNATVAKKQKLGLDCDPTGWSNGIQLKAFIKNHSDDFTYDIKRVKKWVIWEKINGQWKLTTDESKETEDDTFNTDEYLIPQKETKSDLHYIYSMDRPGVGAPPFWSEGSTEFCLVANFIESVTIIKKTDKTSQNDPATQEWYCRIFLYIRPEGRSMDYEKSAIDKGVTSLDKPED